MAPKRRLTRKRSTTVAEIPRHPLDAARDPFAPSPYGPTARPIGPRDPNTPRPPADPIPSPDDMPLTAGPTPPPPPVAPTSTNDPLALITPQGLAAGQSGLDGQIRGREMYAELGAPGLKRAGGFLQEEFITQLRGPRGMAMFREMYDNDAVVQAAITAIVMPIQQVTWRFQPASADPEAVRIAKFFEDAIEDMEFSFKQSVLDWLSMLRFGHSVAEIVLKVRRGDVNDPMFRSKFNDGLVGWRKIPVRAQESLLQWDFQPNGDPLAMIQVPPPMYDRRYIPLSKCVHFRTTIEKNNPEGRSILRSAYFPYYFKKKLCEIEAIGLERDLNGLPSIGCPAEILNATSGPLAALKSTLMNIVKTVRKDEQGGVLYPLQYDEKGHPKYEFKLISTQGTRAHDTTAIISRYKQDILTCMLADFLTIGHTAVGSRALADPKIDFFFLSVNAILDNISDTFTAQAVRPLMVVNQFPTELTPKLVHGEASNPNLQLMGQFVQALAAAGMPLFPDDSLENYLRGLAKLPQKEEAGMDLLEDIDEPLVQSARARPRKPSGEAGAGGDAGKKTPPPADDGSSGGDVEEDISLEKQFARVKATKTADRRMLSHTGRVLAENIRLTNLVRKLDRQLAEAEKRGLIPPQEGAQA